MGHTVIPRQNKDSRLELLIPGPVLCLHAQHPRPSPKLGEFQVGVLQEQVGLGREKGSEVEHPPAPPSPSELPLWICHIQANLGQGKDRGS